MSDIQNELLVIKTIQEKFYDYNNYNWLHLKNKETFDDYEHISEFAELYRIGRDHTVLMSECLQYKNDCTLKEFMEKVQAFIKNKRSDLKNVSNIAETYANQHKINSWAINEMISLVKEQLKLLDSIEKSFKQIKKSKEYREKNVFSPLDIMYYCLDNKYCKYFAILILIAYTLIHLLHDLKNIFFE